MFPQTRAYMGLSPDLVLAHKAGLDGRVLSAEVVHRVSSSLLGPVAPSFRALSGRLTFTVRRHKFNKDSHSAEGRCSVAVTRAQGRFRWAILKSGHGLQKWTRSVKMDTVRMSIFPKGRCHVFRTFALRFCKGECPCSGASLIRACAPPYRTGVPRS